MSQHDTSNLHGGLFIPDYWELSKGFIAQHRNWGVYARTSDADLSESGILERRDKTIRQNDNHMKALTPFLPNKPMSEISVFEVLIALLKSKFYRKNRPYSDSTIRGRLSLLRDIYNYAELCGHACNDLAFIKNEQLFQFLKVLELKAPERKKLCKKMLDKTRTVARSLTPQQQAKLVGIILDHIEEDGRYLMLAILLYTGMRPSECRGLNWSDFVAFRKHPDRHMLSVARQRDNKNNLVNRLKRRSSYRKIGVHLELEKIIQRRLDYVKQTASPGKDITSLPICCFKNEFNRGCTRSQLSTFANKILKESLRVSEEVMSACTLDMFAFEDDLLPPKKGSTEDPSEDLQVCTYLLRHDFWTWMQASTELSPEDKRYFFGHSLVIKNKDLRKYYNQEDKLWELLLKLDHTIKYLPYHETKFKGILSPDNEFCIANTGYYVLQIPPEVLRSGAKITIALQTNEKNDPLTIKTLTPTRNLFPERPLTLHARCLPMEREETHRPTSNMDYYNIQQRLHFRSKPLVQDLSDTDSELPSDPEDT